MEPNRFRTKGRKNYPVTKTQIYSKYLLDMVKIEIIFPAYHRGYMRECYHKECDKFNTSIATKDKYKFMTSLVQSLVLSVAEMAMNNLDQENSKCISDTLDYLNEKQEAEEVESKDQDTREGNSIE